MDSSSIEKDSKYTYNSLLFPDTAPLIKLNHHQFKQCSDESLQEKNRLKKNPQHASEFYLKGSWKSIDNVITNSNSDFYQRKLIHLISKLNKNLETSEMNLKQQEFKKNFKAQWTLLSKIIDRLLLIIFVFLTVVNLASMIIQVPSLRFS